VCLYGSLRSILLLLCEVEFNRFLWFDGFEFSGHGWFDSRTNGAIGEPETAGLRKDLSDLSPVQFGEGGLDFNTVSDRSLSLTEFLTGSEASKR